LHLVGYFLNCITMHGFINVNVTSVTNVTNVDSILLHCYFLTLNVDFERGILPVAHRTAHLEEILTVRIKLQIREY
jgi:hypothetical protein